MHPFDLVQENPAHISVNADVEYLHLQSQIEEIYDNKHDLYFNHAVAKCITA